MNIGFQEIIGFLFFIFFFVLPMFQKKGQPKGGSKGVPPQRPPAKPGQNPPARPGAPVGEGGLLTETATSHTESAPQTLGELMREIQRKVAEAESKERDKTAPSTATGGAPREQQPATKLPGRAKPTSMPRASTTVGGGQERTITLFSAPKDGGGLVTGKSAPASLGREGPSSQPLAEAAPLQVTRLRVNSRKAVDEVDPHASRLSQAASQGRQAANGTGLANATARQPFIGMSRDELVRGMIWHEILAEPVAKQRLRRAKSQLQ